MAEAILKPFDPPDTPMPAGVPACYDLGAGRFLPTLHDLDTKAEVAEATAATAVAKLAAADAEVAELEAQIEQMPRDRR